MIFALCQTVQLQLPSNNQFVFKYLALLCSLCDVYEQKVVYLPLIGCCEAIL